MSHDLREGAFGLMADLCRDHDLPHDALRLTSHMLLNLGDDATTESFSAISDALPWLAAFIELEKGDGMAYVAHRLEARGGLRSLDSASVEEMLAASNPAPGAWSRRLGEVADLDRRLVELSFRNDRAIRETLLADTRLLRAVVKLLEAGSRSGPAERFRQIFPEWRSVGSRPRGAALAVLEDLEHTWDGGPGIKELNGLSERSRRFELSSTDHLKENGFLPALRAALAVGPLNGPMTSDADTHDWLDDVLSRFVQLREEPSMLALARALALTRWRCLDHIRGAAPLSTLSPWVAYLRGACAELAEAREITLREATSFSHFCLHLMNFCDLAAYEPDAAHDRLRRTTMDLEDELKEFALVGQEQGLTDLQADLERYDAVRWKPGTPRKMVVDRLARLLGGWRKGADASPLGSSPKLDEDEKARAESALDRVFEDSASIAVVAQLLRPATLERADVLEGLEPDAALRIVVASLRSARDLAGLDASRAFTLDFQPLAAWLSRGKGERHELLASLMKTIDVEALALGEADDFSADEGLVFHLDRRQRLVIDIVTTAETQALLTILADPAIEPSLAEMLRAKLGDAVGPLRPVGTSLEERVEVFG